MDVKVRIPARDKVDARPAIMDARAKIPAKAKVDARRLKTVVKERMVAQPVARSSASSHTYETRHQLSIHINFSKHSH
jgi:hypothetical protein